MHRKPEVERKDIMSRLINCELAHRKLSRDGFNNNVKGTNRLMYYIIKDREDDSIVEVYYDELFHDCRSGAWTIRDAATKRQFYFNGFSSTIYDRDKEKIITWLDNLTMTEPEKYGKATEEDVERYKCMKELIG